MKTGKNEEIKIGLLAMPDNENSANLIQYFFENGVAIDFVIYWKPSLKDQIKRVVRKLKASGAGPTLQRIFFALRRTGSADNSGPKRHGFRSFSVPSHNSLECQEILRNEGCDLLLVSTDAIIGSNVLKIPRLATLNAHPGWIPQFRGLGSFYHQLAQGKKPAVSVHKVDEGVDTGPLILRECLEIDGKDDFAAVEAQLGALQHKLLLKVVNLFKTQTVQYFDTFEEKSNLTRGMSAKERRRLVQKFNNGEIALSPIGSADEH